MVVDLIVALLVTLILGALTVAMLRWRRPEEPEHGPAPGTAALVVAILYVVVFFGGRALRPLGFVAAGATWTPFLLVGVLVALLLVAVASTARDTSRPMSTRRELMGEERWRLRRPRGPARATAIAAERDLRAERLAAGFGVLFWVLLLALALALLLASLA